MSLASAWVAESTFSEQVKKSQECKTLFRNFWLKTKAPRGVIPQLHALALITLLLWHCRLPWHFCAFRQASGRAGGRFGPRRSQAFHLQKIVALLLQQRTNRSQAILRSFAIQFSQHQIRDECCGRVQFAATNLGDSWA